MDFELPAEITAKLAELDAFIEAEIKPLERDNIAVLRSPPRARAHRLGQ